MKSHEREEYQHAAAERTRQQGAQQLLLGGVVVLAAHHQHPGDRKHRPDSRHDHRRRDLLQHVRAAEGGAERRRREDRAAVGFVEVGAHAGHVTHVVAHVIRNRRRIAWIVLGDSRLHLTHEVRADIRRLRVDAAADARKERLHRSAHAEGQHRGGDVRHLRGEGAARLDELKSEEGQPRGHVGLGVDELVKDKVPYADVEKPQPHDDQPHHRPRPKRHLQSAVERTPARLRRPRGGVRRRLHPDVAAQTGEEAPRQERHRHERILDAHRRQDREDHEQNDEHQRDDLVLAEQIRHRPLAHIAGDLAHARIAGIRPLHRAEEARRHGKRDERGDRSYVPESHNR